LIDTAIVFPGLMINVFGQRMILRMRAR